MKGKLLGALGLAICIVGCWASTSHAQIGYGYGWGGYPFNYVEQSDRQIPYFAEHPPVYYSYPPIPRSYGQSPYANPPWLVPGARVVQPMMVPNPYVKPEPVPPKPAPKAKKKAKQTTAAVHSAPLQILNPFVRQEASVAVQPNTTR